MNDKLNKKLWDSKMELTQYTNIVCENIRGNKYGESFEYAIEKTKILNSQIEIIEELIKEDI